jgi:hypothetical protein
VAVEFPAVVPVPDELEDDDPQPAAMRARATTAMIERRFTQPTIATTPGEATAGRAWRRHR